MRRLLALVGPLPFISLAIVAAGLSLDVLAALFAALLVGVVFAPG